jgi:hypothetical protein
MKVESAAAPFVPVTVTLESEEELRNLLNVLLYYRVSDRRQQRLVVGMHPRFRVDFAHSLERLLASHLNP